jgi:hypothetical protein
LKFKQYYDIIGDKPNQSPSEEKQERKIIFSLIFMYFAWPDFYRFLSSDIPEHTEGVLQNYLPDPIEHSKSDEKTPIPKKFFREDLVYFVQTAILQSGVSWRGTLLTLMVDLRKVGLP